MWRHFETFHVLAGADVRFEVSAGAGTLPGARAGRARASARRRVDRAARSCAPRSAGCCSAGCRRDGRSSEASSRSRGSASPRRGRSPTGAARSRRSAARSSSERCRGSSRARAARRDPPRHRARVLANSRPFEGLVAAIPARSRPRREAPPRFRARSGAPRSAAWRARADRPRDVRGVDARLRRRGDRVGVQAPLPGLRGPVPVRAARSSGASGARAPLPPRGDPPDVRRAPRRPYRAAADESGLLARRGASSTSSGRSSSARTSRSRSSRCRGSGASSARAAARHRRRDDPRDPRRDLPHAPLLRAGDGGDGAPPDGGTPRDRGVAAGRPPRSGRARARAVRAARASPPPIRPGRAARPAGGVAPRAGPARTSSARAAAISSSCATARSTPQLRVGLQPRGHRRRRRSSGPATWAKRRTASFSPTSPTGACRWFRWDSATCPSRSGPIRAERESRAGGLSSSSAMPMVASVNAVNSDRDCRARADRRPPGLHRERRFERRARHIAADHAIRQSSGAGQEACGPRTGCQADHI